MTAVFLVPTRTFESTGTVVEEYGLEPELIRDNMKQISLIASFYGGNVAARHRKKIYVFTIAFL
ncbi:hypothetical protein [Eisenbergiella sp.]